MQHLPLYLPNEPYLLLFLPQAQTRKHKNKTWKYMSDWFIFQAPVQLHVFLRFVNSSFNEIEDSLFSRAVVSCINRRSGLNNKNVVTIFSLHQKKRSIKRGGLLMGNRPWPKFINFGQLKHRKLPESAYFISYASLEIAFVTQKIQKLLLKIIAR